MDAIQSIWTEAESRLFQLDSLSGNVINFTIEHDINVVIADELDRLGILACVRTLDGRRIVLMNDREVVDSSRYTVEEAIIVDPNEYYAIQSGYRNDYGLVLPILLAYQSGILVDSDPSCRQVGCGQTERLLTRRQHYIRRNESCTHEVDSTILFVVLTYALPIVGNGIGTALLEVEELGSERNGSQPHRRKHR